MLSQNRAFYQYRKKEASHTISKTWKTLHQWKHTSSEKRKIQKTEKRFLKLEWLFLQTDRSECKWVVKVKLKKVLYIFVDFWSHKLFVMKFTRFVSYKKKQRLWILWHEKKIKDKNFVTWKLQACDEVPTYFIVINFELSTVSCSATKSLVS